MLPCTDAVHLPVHKLWSMDARPRHHSHLADCARNSQRDGVPTYPLTTCDARARRSGLCTDPVEETVHRLFDRGRSPGAARLSAKRLKTEQNQLDRFFLCTNTVHRPVHSLWACRATPEPSRPRRRRALFVQSGFGLMRLLQVLVTWVMRSWKAV